MLSGFWRVKRQSFFWDAIDFLIFLTFSESSQHLHLYSDKIHSRKFHCASFCRSSHYVHTTGNLRAPKSRRSEFLAIAHQNYIPCFVVRLVSTPYLLIFEAPRYYSTPSGQWWVKYRQWFVSGLQQRHSVALEWLCGPIRVWLISPMKYNLSIVYSFLMMRMVVIFNLKCQKCLDAAL